MNEWVLILTLSAIGNPGEIRDVSPQMLSGFSSKQLCDEAGTSISQRLISLVSKDRKQKGTLSNPLSEPAIWYECISIKK